MRLTGLHHVTAVTAVAGANHAFYTGVLGMRLVKKTVNQDDTSAYHLFYADGDARPGTDLTFFDWPVARERRGNGTVTRTGLRVAGQASLDWWGDRLRQHGVVAKPVIERDGRAVLDCEDPEGQRLTLVDDGGVGDARPWSRGTVPPEHQIRGLGPVTMSVADLAGTSLVLTDVLGMRPARSYRGVAGETHVFTMDGEGPGAELHVEVVPGQAAAVPGAGGVHHVAFRTPDDAGYLGWIDRLATLRVPNSGAVDRYYFRSLYFREPNGVLFEIATDGPGFATDEPADRLGEKLALPPFLEGRRAAIEAGLKPLETAA